MKNGLKDIQSMTNKQPEKKYYDVKIEATVPATFIYRVLASSPEEAITIVKYTNPTSIKYLPNKRKDIKTIVYDAYTTLIRLIKNV